MENSYPRFLLIACIFLSIGPQAVFGQQLSKHEIGFEGGAGISFLRGLENIEEYLDPALCYTLGISYQYSFSERFSFYTAVDYERKGSTANIPVTSQIGEYLGEIVVHSNYNYLVLPLLARFSFGSNIKLYINMGPYVGYLLKFTSITEENDIIPHTKLDLTDETNRYDFGISAGLGARIPINDMLAFKVEVRNNLGLVNIISQTIEDGGVVKTNSTNLLLGVTFAL